MDLQTWITLLSLFVAVPGAMLAIRSLRAKRQEGEPQSGPGEKRASASSVSNPRGQHEVAVPSQGLHIASTEGGIGIAGDEERLFAAPVKNKSIARTACDKGPYEVSPGEHVSVELDLSPGGRLVGKLEAAQDFDFDLLTEHNYVRWLRDEDVPAIRSGSLERAYRVTWTIRGKGPWVLVMTAKNRRYSREVEVDLRVEQR